MPVLDGYDTAREIRRREAAEQRGHVPIIAMTANAMLGDRELCLAAGMDDYMAKPISPTCSMQMLDRWLPATRTDGQVLDQARLVELRSAFPGERWTPCSKSSPPRLHSELDQIEAAARQGDRASVAAAAHRLKNSAGMIGADTPRRRRSGARRSSGHRSRGRRDLRRDRHPSAVRSLEPDARGAARPAGANSLEAQPAPPAGLEPATHGLEGLSSACETRRFSRFRAAKSAQRRRF